MISRQYIKNWSLLGVFTITEPRAPIFSQLIGSKTGFLFRLTRETPGRQAMTPNPAGDLLVTTDVTILYARGKRPRSLRTMKIAPPLRAREKCMFLRRGVSIVVSTLMRMENTCTLGPLSSLTNFFSQAYARNAGSREGSHPQRERYNDSFTELEITPYTVYGESLTSAIYRVQE